MLVDDICQNGILEYDTAQMKLTINVIAFAQKYV
jgi:hypothetical protein